MNKYMVTVKHDNGKISFIVPATSEEAAIEIVMGAEKCPRIAIRNIKKIQLIKE